MSQDLSFLYAPLAQPQENAGKSQDWHEQEHTVASVQSCAQNLLHAAGSADLAKHAIDVAAQDEPPMAPYPQIQVADRPYFD